MSLLPITERFNSAMFYLGLFMMIGASSFVYTQHEELAILKIKISHKKEDLLSQAESLSNTHEAYDEAISDLKIIHFPNSCKYSVESINDLKSAQDEVSFGRASDNFSRWRLSCLDSLSSLTQSEMHTMKESELSANKQLSKLITKMIEERKEYIKDLQHSIIETKEFIYKSNRFKIIRILCGALMIIGAFLTVVFGWRWYRERN
ncbi:hypothetical protein [Pseudoalteromonas sp. Z1A8]|uniref:hypothetical protein n=1 Tax=Pseudoalteromonas sp. Z1A8 TaxID=2686354 RepID=UPI00140BDC42|nr:hypothetical protein [Pseudoalteromonas sp. Z1A8]